MNKPVRRFDVVLISLDPVKGREMKKTRPCLVISPDEMNAYIRTIIVAPMTSTKRPYPTRINCSFQKVRGQIVFDQIRTVDKSRLVRRLGIISSTTQKKVLAGLAELFAP